MLGSSNALFVSRDHSCPVTHRLNCPIAHRANAAQGGHNLKYSRLTVRVVCWRGLRGLFPVAGSGGGEEFWPEYFWCKKGAVYAPKCFQAWGYGRPWPPELSPVFLTWA